MIQLAKNGQKLAKQKCTKKNVPKIHAHKDMKTTQNGGNLTQKDMNRECLGIPADRNHLGKTEI